MANETRYVTPLVRKIAAQHGVDVNAVAGTGVGGRITKADVQAAAGIKPSAPAAPRRRLAPVASLPSVAARSVTQRSLWSPQQDVTIDPYGLNPLVDDAKQALQASYAAAVKEGPAPTLFPGGDLPLFVASGADPQMLLQLPWVARHPASVADASAFAQLMQMCVGPDGVMEAVYRFGEHGLGGFIHTALGMDGNQGYHARVRQWLEGSWARAQASRIQNDPASLL